MEYRCIIVGDPVVEPYALLRRLLYDPFSEEEERALRRESLLTLRSREACNERVPTHVAPPPGVPDRWLLTMSNPSMPSVSISIRFSVVTDPQKLLEVTAHGYRGRLTAQGLYPPSAASGADGSGVAGFPLYQPHCVVVCFNPFSLRSFLRMRAEWTHFLDFTHQRSSSNSASLSGAFNPLAPSTPGKRPKGLMGGLFLHEDDSDHRDGSRSRHESSQSGNSMLGDRAGGTQALSSQMRSSSSYSSAADRGGHAADHGPGTDPTVIFVATRTELMRQAIESTPTIEVPTSSDVAETAQWIGARAYVEHNTNMEDNVDTLRLAIARACVGDLADAPVVGYDVADQQRGESVAHAIEDIHANPDGDPLSSSSSSENGAEAMLPLRSNGDRGASRTLEGSLVNGTSARTEELDEANSTVPLERGDTLVSPDSDVMSPPREETGSMKGSRPSSTRAASRKPSCASGAGEGGIRGNEPGRRRHGMVSRWTYRHHERTGRVFYVNRETHKSQYARPNDYDGREPTPPSSASESSSSSGRSTHNASQRLEKDAKRDSRDGRQRPRSSSSSRKSSTTSTLGDCERATTAGRSNHSTSTNKKESAAPLLPASEQPGQTAADANGTERPGTLLAPSAATPGESTPGEAATLLTKQTASRHGMSAGGAEGDSLSSSSLLSLKDVNYGEDAWDAEAVLRHMREDRRRQQREELDKQRAAIDELECEKHSLLRQQKANAERSAQLVAMRDEVEAKQKEVSRTMAEEEANIDTEIVRLAFAIKAVTERVSLHNEDSASASSDTSPALNRCAAEGQAVVDGGTAAAGVPVPRAEELTTYGANLMAAEAELDELLNHLEQRQSEFWELRAEVMRSQAEHHAAMTQLSVLATQRVSVDQEEAALRRQLRETEAQLLTVEDAVRTLDLLGGRARATPAPAAAATQETEEMVSSDKGFLLGGDTASSQPEPYVKALMDVWGRIEAATEGLKEDRAALGRVTLSHPQERQRLQLLNKEAATTVTDLLLVAANEIYEATLSRNALSTGVARLLHLRRTQRALLEGEEDAVIALRDRLWGLGVSTDAPARKLSAGLGLHLDQLHQLLVRFDEYEDTVLRDLVLRCEESIDHVHAALPTEFGGHGTSDQTRNTADHQQVARAVWVWLTSCTKALTVNPEYRDAKTVNAVRALLHDSLDHSVTYGPHSSRSSSVDDAFLGLLQPFSKEHSEEEDTCGEA